jgi:scyllo-inositol 2-dehydrogenase (NAD+)
MKAAVIGCGRMGAAAPDRLSGTAPAGWLPISHAACLSQLPGVELCALGDTSAEALQSAGELHGVKALYSNHRELLREVRPEILAIATRTPGKCDIIACALENGVRGIYVEKPLANSLRDCRATLEAAMRAGVKIAYGVNRRYHSTYREARRLLACGIIGELREITIEHGHSQLLWAHPHSTDLILFFAGTARPLTAQAMLEDKSFARTGAECVDSDPRIEHAHFTFDSPLTATIGRTDGLNVRLGGTKGNLTVLADGTTLQLELDPNVPTGYFTNVSTLRPVAERGATLTAFMELVESVRTGGPAPLAPNEILQGTALLLGCAWSHLQGGVCVPLAGIPENLVVTGRFGNAYA